MLLLDTHAFLWFLNDDDRLPSEISKVIQTCDGVYISIATFWEMAVKNSLGKLELPRSVSQMMEDCSQLSFTILPIYGRHLERVTNLPWHHRDPFDRLLISQAKEEGLTLVTADRNVRKYDVKTLWT